MADELKLYPVGRLALGNGDLVQVTNIRHRVSNNGAVKHTMRRSASWIARGPLDTELSFDAVSDEDGFERDYWRLLRTGTKKQFRIKIPRETINVTGMVSERTIETSTDDVIKYSITVIGKTEAITTAV